MTTPRPGHPPAEASPYRSFWMGGYEGADHVNAAGRPLDMASANGHADQLDDDYARAASLGLSTVRESIGWRLAEPSPGQFDLQRVRRMADAADRHGLQVLWTFMHYGTPADVSLFDDGMIERFVQFASAVATELAPRSATPPVYNLINEIGFLAWAVSETNLLHPYRGLRHDAPADSLGSGYEVKRRLVRAVLEAMRAIRRIDPRARFLHVEPLVHVVAPPGRSDLLAAAAQIADYQWQAFDLLCGRVEPALGGHPGALDLIGVNHYHSGQWEAGTEARLEWHDRDPRRKRFSDMLADVWQRYRRPLIVSETSHFGDGRGAWLSEVASEVARAQASGVPVLGMCLYPLIDRPDWDDPQHWHRSGLWDVPPSSATEAPPAQLSTSPPASALQLPMTPPTRAFEPDADPPASHSPRARSLCSPYAAALARWQETLPRIPFTGPEMPTLIVFSHLRWHFVYQRPQHLLTRLARHYRVLFVEEPIHADGPPRIDRLPQGPQLDVLQPRTPVEAPGFHDDQLPVLKPLLAEYLRANGIDDYLLWFYTPMALPLMAQLHPRAVVYDCMDELSAFKDAPRQLRQRETALLKTAGLVLTGGPALYESKRPHHANVHCLPSSVDVEHFGAKNLAASGDMASEAQRLQGHLPHPRIGFFGVIDERLDVALLETLAERRPEWQIVMVGPVVKIDPARLPQRPNLHWLGMQPYALLPHLVAEWDVCMMPFALNDSTRFISPTKTLEYMAAGKPVVSTAVRDVEVLYADVVRIAADVDAFIAACDAALAETAAQRDARLAEMRSALSRSSWDRSADQVHAWIEDELAKAPHLPLNRLSGLVGGSEAAEAIGATPAMSALPRQVRHLVIGAGPTGLSAAYHLGLESPGRDTLLIERGERVGGWCRSIEEGGFTFDCAGHIMFSNDAYVLGMYTLLLGDNVHWQNREAWIYSKQVYTRYPFQGALFGLPPKVLTECLVGAIEARFGSLDGTAAPRVGAAAKPANFEEFIQRIWGSGIAEHFATPYNQKLWAMPLNEMETSWLGGRVPMPDLRQMIEGALEPTPPPMGPNARFGYPLRGGFQALMDGFVPLLRGETALDTEVLHVSPARRTVRLDDGRSLRFESLVSTMPLPQLVEACGDEAPAEVQAAARALRHVSVRCVNLGIGLAEGVERLTEKHWIYYPEDTVFHRIFVQGNASPHCNPPGGFGLTCEITYNAAKPLPCDGAALIERVIADCRRVGIFGADDPVLLANQIDMPCAYVVYDHARAANVAIIREWFDGFGIVLAGRYSEWEYYNSDHAFLAGRDAAAKARARLETPAALVQARPGRA